jgi:Leucine-rich repeat (LRR) protein
VKELLGKFLDVKQGLHVLAQKSLISFYGETIRMHTLLEQFGRETSCKQFVHHGYRKHQLLVGERDICEVLDDDTRDNRRFIGINLDLRKNEKELKISEKTLERMHDFQFVRINDVFTHKERQKLLHFKIIHQPERVQLALEDLIYHSPRIRSLKWFGYQNICLPSTFNPEFLVELDMSSSKLRKLWEGTKQLRNLKWMDLSDSEDLKELPNLSTATNLEELKLRRCSSLVELPSSIEKLTSLQILDLHSCSSLVELPSFGNATKLEKLDLENCSSLVKLPPSINANNLQELSLRNCSRVVELPAIENATNLRELKLQNCSSLIELPLSWVKRMSRLRVLTLNNCNNLVSLPQLPDSLDYIYADNCKSLERLDCCFNNPEISLYFPNCFKLNQEARDLIMHTSTSRFAMLPGTQVPACFIHRATSGDYLKIKLKESPFPTTLRFKACIMLVKVNEEMSYDQRSMSVDIVISVHQAIKVQCTPSYHHIYPVLTEHIYTFELEVEEVTSTELVFEFISFRSNWKIGECGILQR